MVAQPDLLAEAFADDPTALPNLCPLGKLIEASSEAGKTRIGVWLATSSVANAEIIRRLQSKGISVSKDTVGQHRRGECRCKSAA